MIADSEFTVPLKSEHDIVMARHLVRKLSSELSFSLVEQTKMVTAASELARNALTHGKGGAMSYETVTHGARRGLKLVFEDHGPGIADLSLALKDGWTSGGGLGMGLSGSKRLVDEFVVESEVGKGTRVTVVRWGTK